MPTVLRVDGYRFFFYSNESSGPPHIHMQKAEGLAKFWLNPISLVNASGFQQKQIVRIEQIIREHQSELERAWHEYFTK